MSVWFNQELEVEVVVVLALLNRDEPIPITAAITPGTLTTVIHHGMVRAWD